MASLLQYGPLRAFCYCGAARGEARGEVPSAVRLPIAALLVGFGWTQAAAQQTAAVRRHHPRRWLAEPLAALAPHAPLLVTQ
jgi:hypothetical protein